MIETELKWLIFFLTHWVQASEVFLLLSNPHGYYRWCHHRASYRTFKKEMWGKGLQKQIDDQ